LKAAQDSGTPLPPALANAPLLNTEYQRTILSAFWDLSSCRAVGMAVGPVPWTVMNEFAQVHGYNHDKDEYEAFMYLIQQLDSVYMNFQAEKQEASRGGKS
jgi:hypothetical protein